MSYVVHCERLKVLRTFQEISGKVNVIRKSPLGKLQLQYGIIEIIVFLGPISNLTLKYCLLPNFYLLVIAMIM